MHITCLSVCHNKPLLMQQAVESIFAQTHQDWEMIVFDSGVLYDRGYYSQFPWQNDSRFRLYRSNETQEMRTTKTMVSWCWNECFRRDLVKGEIVCYLADDDIYYDNALQTFAKFFTDHPESHAVYASEDYGNLYHDLTFHHQGYRRAVAMAGICCGGVILNCSHDYLQFCHRKKVIEALGGNEWWAEDKRFQHNADGEFMERVGRVFPIHPIDVVVGCNRRTPWSMTPI